ncbi:MAG: hypothetical protein WAT39_15210 [Planctomycetota bacterium]
MTSLGEEMASVRTIHPEERPLAIELLLPKDDATMRDTVRGALQSAGYELFGSVPSVVSEGTGWRLELALLDPVEVAEVIGNRLDAPLARLWARRIPYALYFGNYVTILVPRRLSELARQLLGK